MNWNSDLPGIGQFQDGRQPSPYQIMEELPVVRCLHMSPADPLRLGVVRLQTGLRGF